MNIECDQHLSPRATAVLMTQNCVENGLSLSTLLPRYLENLPAQQRPLTQELGFGVLRWYFRLDALLTEMLSKPLRGKKRSVHFILLVGLYQLMYLDKPAYAVVKETVEIAAELNQKWAKGLINAILRRFLREREQLLQKLDLSWRTLYAYPDWLIDQLKSDWKVLQQDITQMLSAGNQRPPMTLRVNSLKQTVEQYRQSLQAEGIISHRLLQDSTQESATNSGEDALVLEKPLAVERLPGFTDGAVSVQDGAAQLAARLLNPQASEQVLDACAAPGGKTMHMLELQPALSKLIALDISAERLQQVAENLHRGGWLANPSASASTRKLQLLCHDASTSSWWDGQQFDRILLDAPCSATGVIRRHPDIKVLRRATDLAALLQLQQAILNNLWDMLKPGGTLLYVTCSILRAENDQQIDRFLHTHPDAAEAEIQAPWGRNLTYGRQILPGEHNMDGFYFAQLIKQS